MDYVGGAVEYSVTVQGNKPGSYTIWNKAINSQGRTIRVFHDTYSNGNFLHRSHKFPGTPRHVYSDGTVK